MRLMHEYRLGVVGNTDMRRLANTFLRGVYRGRPGRFAQMVSGQGAAGPRVQHLGYYTGLTISNRAVADVMRDNLEMLGLDRGSGSAAMFVALASQLKSDSTRCE